jgi:cytochrome c oxidase assembly protein subunit 15
MGFFTCSSVFLLFFFGGLVRATGSGMGCPDWPKCFGLWAPPTCECKLPGNYQQIFLEKRLQKVERFAKVLTSLGMEASAEKLRSDKSIQQPEAFHPVKAWIEYINRLFGVLSGLFAMVYFGMAVWFRGRIASGKGWGLVGLLLLLVNGWLGSLVVATNLLPGVVTLHFLLSFLCLFAYMVSLHKAVNFKFNGLSVLSTKQWFWLWISVFFVVIIGAWSREQVDSLRLTEQLYVDGDSAGFLGWGMLNVFAMDWIFALHRYMPFVVLGWMIWLMRKSHNGFSKNALALTHPLMVIALLCISQIAFGVIHIWFVVPAWTQVAHVVVGSGLITYIFAVYLSARVNPS